MEEINEKDLKTDVLKRLIEFKEYTGMSLNSYAAGIGMTHATLHNQMVTQKRALSLDTVLATLDTYSELSAEWLLRDRGDMLVSKFADTPEGVALKYSERIESLMDTITLLNEAIKTKNATIDALQQELAQYKSKNKAQ